MAYTMNIRGRQIYLALMARSVMGDYIVYEWNDGVFIPSDEEEMEDEDDLLEEEAIEEFENADECEEEEMEDFSELLDEEENEIETAVREDIEAILADGFVPQGGVSSFITAEYTTCYTQAFFRKK